MKPEYLTALLIVLSSGYSTTGKMPFILLGYLTLQPKSIKSTSATGTLYVEDNFEAVVCEVKNHRLLIKGVNVQSN